MDTYQKARDGGYKNLLEYPKNPVAKPRLSSTTPNAEEAQEYVQQFKAYWAEETLVIAGVQKWREENARLERQLEFDLASEYGLIDHPKRDKIWAKAWDQGHSGGYSEVCLAYDDLVELLL